MQSLCLPDDIPPTGGAPNEGKVGGRLLPGSVSAMSLDYRQVIADESARLFEIIESGPLDASIGATDDWKLGDLARHIGDVQRWATYVIEHGGPGEPAEDTRTVDEAVAAFPTYTAGLLKALDGLDPEAELWNFTSGPQVGAFWLRRQALEVAVHRWDAESAVSDAPTPIPAKVAADVIDEFVHVMMPRVIDRENIDVASLPGDVHLHCTDTKGEWTFEIIDGALVATDEHRKSAVAVRGGASDLALFVYGRLGSEAVEVFGDTDALAAWQQAFGL